MFKNRQDAAEKLALTLEKYRNTDALVVGIPRGGVETAYYVARYLNADMTVVVTRKLGYPFNPEAAFGAVAEDGSVYMSPIAVHNLTQEEIDKILEKQKKEIRRRVNKLRKGEPLPDMNGRTVIITDDGIATGATLFATIMLCKKMNASKIIVAAPIAGERMEKTLLEQVDEVMILEKPYFYSAVSQGYETFDNLTDEEALGFINKWSQENKVHLN